MRIAYGIMGYGHGHAMRSSAILARLAKHHEVKVYAGPDAYEVMRHDHDCTPIPCIHYRYGERGHIDPWKTVRENLSPAADLLFQGPAMRELDARGRRFRPQVVISDSEAYTHQLARRWRIPRISLDHVGIMAYCKPQFPIGGRWPSARCCPAGRDDRSHAGLRPGYGASKKAGVSSSRAAPGLRCSTRSPAASRDRAWTDQSSPSQ